MSRLLDILVSAVGLIVLSPILLGFCLAIWLQDFHSPFYVAKRIGLGGKPFSMVKLRSMIWKADSVAVTSTSDRDNRITTVGKLIRRFKLDEFVQLWNVLLGDMSLVGPRPNVATWGVDLYTEEEMRLLTVRPGITDFSSIVFADEGSILAESDNPDLHYNQVIRPWKSRLSLLYIDDKSMWLDIKLVYYTILSVVSRASALRKVAGELERIGASPRLIEVASRTVALEPYPPPGSEEIASF